MAGKKNEDRYGVSAFLADSQSDYPVVLAVLCDGIGGHRAGEVAADIGVRTITETIAASDGRQPLMILERAIKKANHAIYQASLSDQGRKGMGATCACALVMDNQLYTGNLGDSRIYLLRDGHILQLSTDHTWLQEAYDAGIIDERAGEAHPNAHVIRRYLGSPKAPQPDFRLWFFEGEGDAEALNNQGLLLEPGDVILVCSDGLTDLVSDEEIQAVVKSTPFADIPKVLIDLANARGGHDNITVILMATPVNKGGKPGKQRKRRRLVGCLFALIIISLLFVAIYFGLHWWGDRVDLPVTVSPVVTEPLPTQASTITPMTPTPTVTFTPESVEGMMTPRPSITPWPTHTTAP
jgi:protein phosphatase